MGALIVITRPRNEAEPLASQLAAGGYETLIEPMLDIVPTSAAIPSLAHYSGLVFTSANAARIFAGRSQERSLPAYAVGGHTAAELRAAGFSDIRQASGDAEQLASLIKGTGDLGPLLHLSGVHVARDLGDLLAPAPRVDRIAVYDARVAIAISPRLAEALYARTVIHVLFFSVRTAETFGTLLRERGLADMITSSSALCLSGQISEAAQQLPWHSVQIASAPNSDALLALLPRLGVAHAQ